MAIELHDLKPAPGAHKAKTRVGRGEGSKGKTAGRGTKGTGARKNVPEFFAGGQMPIHMQAPKLGGFHNPFRTEYQVVNLDKVEALFPKGGKITVELTIETATEPVKSIKMSPKEPKATDPTVGVEWVPELAFVDIIGGPGEDREGWRQRHQALMPTAGIR